MAEPETKRMRWTFDEPCTTMERNSGHPVKVVAMAPEHHVDVLMPALPYTTAITILLVAPDSTGTLDTSHFRFLPQTVHEEMGVMISECQTSLQNGSVVGAKTLVFRSSGHRYALVGLGNLEALTHERVGLKVGVTIANICMEEKGCKTCILIPPDHFACSPSFLEDMTCSLRTQLYSDNRYRTGDNKKVPAENLRLVLIHMNNADEDWVQDSINRGNQLSEGQTLAKDIVNAPHNVLNSESLADLAKALANESISGKLTCSILGKKECESLGMGAYLAVARGSETEPQFIHMTYKSDGAIKRKVGVVGKGLLFDTGGYNIKTQMMELMKFDCGGAAAVLGAAKAIDSLAPKGIEVHFIIAACENMISAKAYVPSDVLTASNSKTIEVYNTDAEGRLTLADALVYADKTVGCEKIIELSTLTGACMAALGKQIAGVFTESDELAQELDLISKATGEKTWRMPMEQEYSEQIESIIADLKNCGTKYGGAITAALFLQHFVDPQKPFAHIDIAGPVWNEKKGATGFGVKLVTDWVSRQGQD